MHVRVLALSRPDLPRQRLNYNPTLTVAVTHPGTNVHNSSLTSSKVHTTVYPLGHWNPNKGVKSSIRTYAMQTPAPKLLIS